MRHKFSLALVAALAAFPLGSAIAQVGKSGYSLPLALAVKAATKAIATCASNGYPVSAVVVDPSGVIKLEAKGDHSTIHTTTSAFRKAYTVVTFGPIFRFDASSAFAELVAKNPNGSAFATLPNIVPLAGGVAIVRDAVDCGMFSSRPAAEKLPLRATRANNRSAKRRSLIARVNN